MSEHTPGPWTSYTGTHSIWAEGKRAICIMTGARKTADMERDANARLIAAAPYMLSALEYIRSQAVPGDVFHAAADAAIAKATGAAA